MLSHRRPARRLGRPEPRLPADRQAARRHKTIPASLEFVLVNTRPSRAPRGQCPPRGHRSAGPQMLSLGRRGGQRRAGPRCPERGPPRAPVSLGPFPVQHQARSKHQSRPDTKGINCQAVHVIDSFTHTASNTALRSRGGCCRRTGEVREFERLERGRLDTRTRGSRAISPSEQHLVHKMDKAKMTKK